MHPASAAYIGSPFTLTYFKFIDDESSVPYKFSSCTGVPDILYIRVFMTHTHISLTCHAHLTRRLGPWLASKKTLTIYYHTCIFFTFCTCVIFMACTPMSLTWHLHVIWNFFPWLALKRIFIQTQKTQIDGSLKVSWRPC